jgi:phosphomannomutase
MWTLPEEPWKFLETRLIHSPCTTKTGNHFDIRPGMLNFSILGRNATLEQRHAYVEYDTKTQERKLLADEFNSYFSDKYDIAGTLGGETGIDISARGKDKGQILKDFDKYDEVVFFGDRTEPGGNDYALAKLIIEAGRGYVFQVDHWVTTYKTLLNIE